MEPSSKQLYPPDEARRLSALRRYDILDTPTERTFDRITAMAARLFSVPMAVISLVDESRIWFKSHHGLNVQEIARDPGLCASAILQHEPWVLPDAAADERSKDNALVTGPFGLRFYVGVPLTTQDGFNIGMLCVLGQEPREVSQAQLADLKDLAAIAMDQLELRLATRRALAGANRMAGERESALEMAGLIAREYEGSVQNSLELITGLLRQQSHATKNAPEAAQLTFSANRVAAIHRAHQHISSGAGMADATGYLKSLCADLGTVSAAKGVESISADGVSLSLPPRPLIAIGLIVNELCANAAKRGARHVEVLLEAQPAGHALTVQDDGAALPGNFDPSSGDDLGMKIVAGQAQHIRGIIVANPGAQRGAKFTVFFNAAGLD